MPVGALLCTRSGGYIFLFCSFFFSFFFCVQLSRKLASLRSHFGVYRFIRTRFVRSFEEEARFFGVIFLSVARVENSRCVPTKHTAAKNNAAQNTHQRECNARGLLLRDACLLEITSLFSHAHINFGRNRFVESRSLPRRIFGWEFTKFR